jgi:serine phosphatase RsbU (regulator of sigma subunit)
MEGDFMTSETPDPFVLTGVKKIHVPRLDASAWRFLLVSVGASIAGWLVHFLFGTRGAIAAGLAALALTTAWTSALRMLFLDAKAKKFWLVWLAGGALFVVLSRPGSSTWAAGASFAFVFLAIRKYRPFSHLSHRHRARAFFLGLLTASALSWGWVLGRHAGFAWAGSVSGWFQNVIRYDLIALQFFWLFALLHIFFKARLHSVNIRPKLAISTLFIAIVPLGLVFLIGLAGVYSILGEVQAARAVRLLEEWSEISGRDPEFGRSLSSSWFLRETSGGKVRTEGSPPSWLDGFVGAKKKAAPLPGTAEPASTTGRDYFWIGPEAWLIKWTPASDAGLERAWGCPLDSAFMDRLARILHADVQITATSPIRLSKGKGISIDVDFNAEEKERGGSLPGIVGRYDASRPPLKSWFGMTHLDVKSFSGGTFEDAAFLVSLKTSVRLIRDEVYSSKNPLSQVVIGGLIVMAVLLLILEAFALFFGIRISSGITSAVRTLHAGTRRIAAGDLDTRIEVPNEDELGDLAASFNEMAAAVKRGKEEALRRERLERDLLVAREIQEQLLPHAMPSVQGFEISGASLPSQQVGGDYFDFLDMPEGRLGVAIADVSGKGIPAALLMANLQAILHGQAEGETDPATVVARINNFLVRSTDPRMFATFVYGILDRQKAVLSLVNAGHNPPYILRAADGRLEKIDPSGLILGFLPDQGYTTVHAALDPGDIVLLYTDGITEAFDPALARDPERFFGEERLVRVLRASAGGSASEIQAAILAAVAGFASHAAQNDDITLVVIKRRASPS